MVDIYDLEVPFLLLTVLFYLNCSFINLSFSLSLTFNSAIIWASDEVRSMSLMKHL